MANYISFVDVTVLQYVFLRIGEVCDFEVVCDSCVLFSLYVYIYIYVVVVVVFLLSFSNILFLGCIYFDFCFTSSVFIWDLLGFVFGSPPGS